MLRSSLSLLGLALVSFSYTQTASIQDCLGAIPVCQQIYQETLAPTGNGNVVDFLPGDICLAGEDNSIWYTFTVNQTGKFGFLLTPNDPNQDYDWALFDITNATCEDLATNAELVVSCNAAGKEDCDGPTGATGASDFAIQGPNCGTFPPTINAGFSSFNELVDVEGGNTYVLVILNFSAELSQGYTLDFGLSAGIGIFDETPPSLAQVDYPKSCFGQELSVQFSEYIQCATISSENFQITGTGEPYSLSLSSVNCDAGGNYSKSFFLAVNPPIPFGAEVNLSLLVDGVTEALDLCGNPAAPRQLDFGGPTLTDVLDLGPDTTICSGNTISLEGDISGSYFWSDGSNFPILDVSSSGSYWLTINTACGSLSDTILVEVSPIGLADNILGNDTLICPASSLILDASSPGSASYLWQDGSTGSTFTATQAGTYSVNVVNECGEAQDEIKLSLATPIDASITTDSICAGETLTYDVTTVGASYSWQDGSTDPSLTVSTPGTYSVVISTACEQLELSAEVSEKSGVSPIFDLGNDTTLCPGTDLLLEIDAPGAMIQWQDGSTASSFLVDQPGTYSVMASNECGQAVDEIIVAYSDPMMANVEDASLCAGDSVVWDVSNTGATYLWQDGATDAIYTTYSAGSYSVMISNACETLELAAEVEQIAEALPLIKLGNDTTLCLGEELSLEIAFSDVTIAWQDGSTSPSFLIDQPGNYMVTVNNACESQSASLNVGYRTPMNIALGQDTVLCPGQSLVLDASDENALSYTWQNGSSESTFLTKEPGTYTVLAANECEEVMASIDVEACEVCNVYVPNAFSPNNDGSNDLFRPYINCSIESYKLQIFDRWGGLVFETESIEGGWDGRYQNRVINTGVYLYSIQLSVLENNERKEVDIAGSITVL